jgi:Crinkler effector protein N-terminal domain
MSLTLELNCLVLGDDPSHIFPVKIASTESVGTLKQLIREKKHAFQHVDADTLELFRVSFPVDDDLEATLNRIRRRPEHDPENGVHHLSLSVKRLKGVFGGPTDDEHLHVIVQSPHTGEHQSLRRLSITHRSIVK